MLSTLALLLISVETSSTTLTLPAYVSTYRAQSSLLPLRRLDADIAAVEVERRRVRATSDLTVEPTVGARLYHHTPSPLTEVVAEVGAIAGFVYASDRGTRYGVSARASFPTRQGRLGRSILYGLDGRVALPLLRNFGGREFDYQIRSAEQRADQAEALFAQEELLYCADAMERYVVLYAASAQQEAYDKLLAEKRRVWFRTASDYQKKLITRLDLLSAKSDWVFAQSLMPGFSQRRGRADAALRAFAALPEGIVLVEPERLASVESPRLEEHPQHVALEAAALGFEQEILLAREGGKQELDLSFNLGVDRFHNVFDPRGLGPGETTDVRGIVGLRYLLPVERPEIGYRIRILERQLLQVEQQQIELLRNLRAGIQQSRVTVETEAEAYRLLEDQLKVLRSQIRAAYQEFRAGKLEFQNYLDHWDRYQRARLDIWDRWLSLRLAEIALIPLTGVLPEVCRAPPS